MILSRPHYGIKPGLAEARQLKYVTSRLYTTRNAQLPAFGSGDNDLHAGDIAVLFDTAYDSGGQPIPPSSIGNPDWTIHSGVGNGSSTYMSVATCVVQDDMSGDSFAGMTGQIIRKNLLIFRTSWEEGRGASDVALTSYQKHDVGSGSFISHPNIETRGGSNVFIAAFRTNPPGPDFYSFGFSQAEVLGDKIDNGELVARYLVVEGIAENFLSELNSAGNINALMSFSLSVNHY